MEVSHGVLKKGLKNDLNPPFLYRRRTQKFHHNKARALLGFFSVVVELNYCNNSKRKRKKKGGN
jgi:hypothetical protein